MDERREPVEIPEAFRRLVKERMEAESLSLRSVAAETGLSPAYLCRMLLGERGLPPDDETLLKLARVLRIDPPEELLIAAERTPAWMKAGMPLFLRATEAVTKTEFDRTMKQIQSFLWKRHLEGKGK